MTESATWITTGREPLKFGWERYKGKRQARPKQPPSRLKAAPHPLFDFVHKWAMARRRWKMKILKSLKMIIPFRRKGAKRTERESEAMALDRFCSHLKHSLKGHAHRSKYTSVGVGSPKMDRRLAQSKMDRTAHALGLVRLKLKSMA